MRYGVLLVLLVLVGCGLPRDPAGTRARVEATTLRVGVVSHPPWADFSGGEPTGIEVELVNQLARELGTQVEWRPGTEADLFAALEVRAVDLVIGGLTADDPLLADSAVTRPHTPRRGLSWGCRTTRRRATMWRGCAWQSSPERKPLARWWS